MKSFIKAVNSATDVWLVIVAPSGHTCTLSGRFEAGGNWHHTQDNNQFSDAVQDKCLEHIEGEKIYFIIQNAIHYAHPGIHVWCFWPAGQRSATIPHPKEGIRVHTLSVLQVCEYTHTKALERELKQVRDITEINTNLGNYT